MLKINSRLKMRLLNLYLRLLTYKGSVFIAKGSVFSDHVSIGTGTRFNGKVVIKGVGKVDIGKYCAIGHDVKIISSNHDYTYVNLQVNLQQRIGASDSHVRGGEVILGHNVWVGDSVIVLPNVKVGNGTVIAAGSVVTKDMPAYAVVAGVPAKVIRYRFSQGVQDEIESSKWWGWDIEKMRSEKFFFNKRH